MGCASSKEKRCRHCQGPHSPVPRSYSMHIHHPPESLGDSYHLVALKSSTLGSLKLDSSAQINHFNSKILNGGDDLNDGNETYIGNVDDSQKKNKEFAIGLIEAKTWSNMIEEKIPKVVPRTPIRTPPGEPETINTWELMEGLEDLSPLRSPQLRSFSFDLVRGPNPIPVDIAFDRPKSRFKENGRASPEPMWLQMGGDELNSGHLISGFDPEIISSFRKSLQDLPPDNPFHLRPLEDDKQQHQQSIGGADNQLLDVDNEKKVNGTVVNALCGKEKMVVYFTSLRGVRKTYEDCCYVRVIVKGLGVRVDERDVSMHSGFKEELKELLGDGFNGGGLPRVFVGKNYVGGAEEIRRLHEDGQLEKLVECCERLDDGGPGLACEACGDVRFVPCESCSGSCKIYYDRDEEEEEEEEDCSGKEGAYGFQRCPHCNENGVIRCPICCY